MHKYRYTSRQTHSDKHKGHDSPSSVFRVQNITSSWDETVLEAGCFGGKLPVAPPRGQELEGVVCRVSGLLIDLAGSAQCPSAGE